MSFNHAGLSYKSALKPSSLPKKMKPNQMFIAQLLREIPLVGSATEGVSSTQLANKTGGSAPTIKRYLERLLEEGQVIRVGQSRATRYFRNAALLEQAIVQSPEVDAPPFPLSQPSKILRALLHRPLLDRKPVSYQREFVSNYEPNKTYLLPADLAEQLFRQGRMPGQQPAGTYARKVLEPLLLELSWSSSRLEGNRYSLLATKELFETGAADNDLDAVMLLNHKQAIEFMVDVAPEDGLSTNLVSNMHSILMRDLLEDSNSLGAIRQRVVNITDTAYVPMQIPAVLEELLTLVIEKARQIRNPVEAAFFLWINLAYLQPFEDGNKRTSRLTANVPLLLFNCAPLSFMDVREQDYAQAMMGIYEHCDVSLATDLFAWTYRRSIEKYKVVLESMGGPDPIRLRHREHLNQAIPLVVQERHTVEQAEQMLKLTPDFAPDFHRLLLDELAQLGTHNCGRYRLTPRMTREWIEAGRPQ